ncbi:MAG: zinc-binding dehydrogenase [Lentisphaeria bacterium]|nr:zinc-binding dehydrogenase [Lentisphaeria bacterium]
MRAAITDGKGAVWLDDTLPVPHPAPCQCLCRVLACASCTGTDLKHIHDKLPWQQSYPGILGHESIGEVVAVGAKVRAYAVGDWVLRPTPVYPGTSLGAYSSMWGGFSEYGLVTDVAALRADEAEAAPSNYTRYQLPVPRIAGISAADWTMIITLKETAGYAASVGTRLNTSVAVLGAGSVGVAMMRVAKVLGAMPVLAVARRDEQLAYATDVIGADGAVNVSKGQAAERLRDLSGGGVDRIIDTSGSLELVAECLPALKQDGKAAGYATYPRGASFASAVPPERLIPGRTGEDTCHDWMISAVRLGLFRLGDFYSERLPLDRIAEGFARLEQKRTMKIVFEMEE